MGNTEMTKYMAAGAFADLSSRKSSFANSAAWLKGLAQAGTFGGKLYGVPYYAGSRVVTYRKDLFTKAGLRTAPNSLAQLRFYAQKVGKQNSTKGSRPSTSRAPTGTSR